MLRNELWDLMLEDGGSDIDRIHTIKKRADRMGYAKRMLVHAIDRSSLGVFNGMMWFFTGKLYESITKAAFHKVLFDLMERRLEMSDGDILNPSAVYYDCDNCVFARPLSISNSVMVFRNGVLDVERVSSTASSAASSCRYGRWTTTTIPMPRRSFGGSSSTRCCPTSTCRTSCRCSSVLRFATVRR